MKYFQCFLFVFYFTNACSDIENEMDASFLLVHPHGQLSFIYILVLRKFKTHISLRV